MAMFLLNLFISLFIKMIVWFIQQNADGTAIPEKKREKLEEALWLTRRLHAEAARAGMALNGKQPAEWDHPETIDLAAFGVIHHSPEEDE